MRRNTAIEVALGAVIIAVVAVIQLTRSAAVELGEHGIRVNSVPPGPVPTSIFGKAAGMDPAAADRTAIQLEPAFLAALESHQPIRRAGTPEDVAQVMLWLASDASSFVKGQDIAVSVVPVLPVALGFVALLAAGNLLAVAPALIAARTPPAAALRAE